MITRWKAWLRLLMHATPLLAGLVALVLVIAWLSGAFESKIAPRQIESRPRELSGKPTEVVHEVVQDYVEEAIGSLKAASRTVISAKVLATINEIAVSAGDEVRPGAVFVRLDGQELEAKLRQAEQSVAAATAAREQAQSAFERAERLLPQNAIARADYDKAATDLQVAKANETRASQSVREATVLLGYTTITAPKSGRVVDRLAEPGDTARPGEPLLVIYDAASLRLEAPVLEQLAVQLTVGDKLTVHVDALGRDVDATVDEIVPQADAPSRSFLVKASLPRADDLYEGMFGRMLIPAGQRRHLCLATDAVQQVGQLEFVDVVLPDGTLQRRMIKTGRLGMPGRIEVLSGLQAGETVVLQGGAKS
jgi:RND family efflux transporter MFP subunit